MVVGMVDVRPKRHRLAYGRQVLFPKRFWEGISAGSVTAAFRRWERARVLAGRRYRTAAGIIEVDSVDQVRLRSMNRDAQLRRVCVG